jgi:predicted RNA binding protein YcfA (HicA-like mRNA interferase family)
MTATRHETVLPVHGNEDLGRPLLRKILKDAGLTFDEFIALL